MNYLNKEYKNLSDCDKKNILPGIIKFLQEEKQKVDDKINGAENGKVFLRRLEIEESDIEGWKEEIESCQQSLVELKEELDNNEITQEVYNSEKEEITKEMEEHTKEFQEEQKKLSLDDILECNVVLTREYESGYEGEWTRDSNDLNVDIICTDNLKINVSYCYSFDNNDHDCVFYKRHVNISKNGEDVPYYTKNGEWIYGLKDTPIAVQQPKSFKILNKILDEIKQKNLYKDFISYMD
tara:strand:- start:2027 stop:2743 length:717 start_codon:yes stop_codon:yes gene_type:complete